MHDQWSDGLTAEKKPDNRIFENDSSGIFSPWPKQNSVLTTHSWSPIRTVRNYIILPKSLHDALLLNYIIGSLGAKAKADSTRCTDHLTEAILPSLHNGTHSKAVRHGQPSPRYISINTIRLQQMDERYLLHQITSYMCPNRTKDL